MKDWIYGGGKIDNLEELEGKIGTCFEELPASVWKSAMTNIHCRLHKC
jgi:hypothetical protein